MARAGMLLRMSFASYANDRRYRRSQSAYLLLLLLILVALWPETVGSTDESSFGLINFLIEWLIPLAFPIVQLRLGFGLLDITETEPPERLPLPRAFGEVAAVTLAENIHGAALWAMQSPLVIAAVTAAGFTLNGGVAYLLRLLVLGVAARTAGVLGRVIARSRSTRPQEAESENRYSRSSSTSSK
jgi:hypothetical protein